LFHARTNDRKYDNKHNWKFGSMPKEHIIQLQCQGMVFVQGKIKIVKDKECRLVSIANALMVQSWKINWTHYRGQEMNPKEYRHSCGNDGTMHITTVK